MTFVEEKLLIWCAIFRVFFQNLAKNTFLYFTKSCRDIFPLLWPPSCLFTFATFETQFSGRRKCVFYRPSCYSVCSYNRPKHSPLCFFIYLQNLHHSLQFFCKHKNKYESKKNLANAIELHQKIHHVDNNLKQWHYLMKLEITSSCKSIIFLRSAPKN